MKWFYREMQKWAWKSISIKERQRWDYHIEKIPRTINVSVRFTYNEDCDRQRRCTSLILFENPCRSSTLMGLTRLFFIEVPDILCETVGNDSSEFKVKALAALGRVFRLLPPQWWDFRDKEPPAPLQIFHHNVFLTTCSPIQTSSSPNWLSQVRNSALFVL